MVRCRTSGEECCLLTTLTDRSKYSIQALSELYWGRWGIEELYKVSKQILTVDEFHANSERGVKQELYAHFNLIAMTRLISNDADGLLADMREAGQKRQTVNFKHAIAMVAASTEELLLSSAQAIAVGRTMQGILRSRSALRSGRSYPRVSKKPRSKWEGKIRIVN